MFQYGPENSNVNLRTMSFIIFHKAYLITTVRVRGDYGSTLNFHHRLVYRIYKSKPLIPTITTIFFYYNKVVTTKAAENINLKYFIKSLK